MGVSSPFIDDGKVNFEFVTAQKEKIVEELISIAVLVATLFAGTMAAEEIYVSVRTAALTKAAQGLPRLSPFAASLTRKHRHESYSPAKKTSPPAKKAIYDDRR